jgi:hypothetical protein
MSYQAAYLASIVVRNRLCNADPMVLDVHKVRQLSRQAESKSESIKRDVEKVLSDFKSLGSDFTSDRLFSREYSQLDMSVKEAVRAIEKVRQAAKDINRKV